VVDDEVSKKGKFREIILHFWYLSMLENIFIVFNFGSSCYLIWGVHYFKFYLVFVCMQNDFRFSSIVLMYENNSGVQYGFCFHNSFKMRSELYRQLHPCMLVVTCEGLPKQRKCTQC